MKAETFELPVVFIYGLERGERDRREKSEERAAKRLEFKPKVRIYRAEKKGWYVVARYFFLALLSFSAWPCLGPA